MRNQLTVFAICLSCLAIMSMSCLAGDSALNQVRAFFKPRTATTAASSLPSPTDPSARNLKGKYDRTSNPQSLTAAPVKSTIKELGKGEDLFQMVRNSQGVVLVDFYAEWCGPCRTQSRILKEMESIVKQAGASVVKVNVGDHPKVASLFRVSALPTLMVVKDGALVTQETGITDRETIAKHLSR